MADIRRATEQDVPAIVQLVRDLAEYEKELDQVEVTDEMLRSILFAESPSVFAHVADEDGSVVGFALWFLSFSTWQGKLGLYLEDFYVRPECRGRGYGKALMKELAKICTDNGYGRFEWSVLDWNEPSIEVYKAFGAEAMDEWTRYRLAGDALNDFAKG